MRRDWELPLKWDLKRKKYKDWNKWKHRGNCTKLLQKPHWISLLIHANLNIIIMLSGPWDIQCFVLATYYYYGLLPRTFFCRLDTKTGSPLPLSRKHWLTKWSECKARKKETKSTKVIRSTHCPWNRHTHTHTHMSGGCVWTLLMTPNVEDVTSYEEESHFLTDTFQFP